jgi:WD40 repeat protein
MELEHVLQAHPGNCICIEFDKTGKYFAVGSADALVSLWDVQSLACVRTFSRLVIYSSFHSFTKTPFTKVGGLDLSRRDLDRDLDLDVQKISVSTVEKISTVFKS